MIRGLFKRRGARQPGWLAISLQPGELHFAHGVGGERGQCAINRCGTEALESDKQLERVAKELDFGRHQCLALLPPADYQMLLVEAPNVPALELKTAVRWRIKDMLDYHVQDATIDLLDIPAEPSPGRAHSMYAVAARNQVIQACIERFTAAHIPLTVIDIPETAQRNIAALLETAERGVALLYLDREQSLLTVTLRGELHLVRRIDVGLDGVEALPGDGMNRLLLELQRSFDHLERQFPAAAPAKLVLAPMPSENGLLDHLAGNLDMTVEELDFARILRLEDGVSLAGATAWRLFHVLGAALRHEAKAL
ncbi:MAG TPA: agglutinin biogenesis protein MshI [Burkholderiales bacterium]|jgi:MSHA biogenesis protein MshI|nr:agglutinin biogenesis protein MshI [Burkholderiales bacterium]